MISILAILLDTPTSETGSLVSTTRRSVFHLQIPVWRQETGFTLIESLTVVALILIIAAIAVPNLLRSRMSANEASATESLRTINRAERRYSSGQPIMGYARRLTALGPNGAVVPCVPDSAGVTGACLIDSELASGTKSGYTISITSAENLPITSYEVIASPVVTNKTGSRYFCESEDGVLGYSTSAIMAGSCREISSRVQ